MRKAHATDLECETLEQNADVDWNSFRKGLTNWARREEIAGKLFADSAHRRSAPAKSTRSCLESKQACHCAAVRTMP